MNLKIANYHPKNLDEFIGKDKIKNSLRVYIESSKRKETSLDHCLLYGHPGTGKTTLSKIIAQEMGVNIKQIQGPDIQSKSDIISAISALNDNDILFIDEIHAMNPLCFEILYSIMDNHEINIKIGKEGNTKITTVKTPKITIIGATTLLGNITSPLEDRFGIIFYLSLYEWEDIFKIISWLNKTFELNISDDDLIAISKNSKGVPRIAKRTLSRYTDFVEIEQCDINHFFQSIGIYDLGLSDIDIEYLAVLENSEVVGLKTISQIINVDEKTIVNKIEPFLLKNKFIIKSSAGRRITESGSELLRNNK